MSSEESASLDHISSEYSVLFFLPSTLRHLPTEHRNVTFGYIKAVTRLLGLQESLCSAERTMNYMIRYAPVVVVLAQSCLTLCNPMDYSTPGFLVLHYFPELAQTHVRQVSDATQHLILCCPLLLLPSICLTIRVFSNELALRIRWPKYWSFSSSPSNEYSGFISFRIDWLISLLSKGLSRVFSSTTVQKHQFFATQLSLWSNSHIRT